MAARLESVALGAALRSRYEIFEKIGEGGYGDVYRARQLATGQMVAVKVLRIPEDREDAQVERLIARFQREMRLCARLHHPNIVRLMDSGQAEGRVVYSVFEFIPGKNLASILRDERRLQPLEARHLMSQVLDALACAHAAGVVHRDLKPANIMIPTGARRNAVILDFGISALTEDARVDEARITRSNEWVGSPAYAAPEQLRGEPPLARSDLYAWGLIFLECLTGERPIRGANAAEAVFKQLSPEPIPIPEWLIHSPLGRILRRVTEKVTQARDVTAEGLLRELDACDLRSLSIDGQSTEPLDAPPNPTMTMPAPASIPRPGEGERRQVTAMCCTLSVVSEETRSADLDEFDSLLGVGQEICTTLAQKFGGHVGGSLSDTVLFLFGYPSAQEDDARRAARAALAMVAEVYEHGMSPPASHRVRLEVRIGIHTGLIITRDHATPGGNTPSIGGATLQVATRLSAQAQPGEILVSGETQRLLRGQFTLEGHGTVDGDGNTYLLRKGAMDAGTSDLPLVGRQQELDALLERWGRVRGGSGQAVLVTGEPGIGKSRLTRALREQIGSEPHHYLEGRCAQDARNSPLYPIVELLERLLDPARELATEARLERLKALLLEQGFELADVLPLFAPLLSLPLPAPFTPLAVSPQKQRELTHNAVLSLLHQLGEKAPVVLFIEDLHWADPSTLELCAALVREVSSGRVFTLFTGRPEFTPHWSSSAGFALQLGHLGQSDIARMAMAVSGGVPLSPETVERIASRTDGVPLFVEELVRALLESNTLVSRDGQLVLTGPLDTLGIPSSLRGLLTARLDRLGRAKETAQMASVLGREFSFELLSALLPLEEHELRDDLDALVNASLVHRKRRLRSPAFIFKHALIQDTAYDSIVKARRRELHERVARTLQRDFPKMAEEQPETLAWHFERARLDAEATSCLLQAGQRAMQRSAFIEAAALLSHGIELAARDPETGWAPRRELELRTILGGALVNSRGYAVPEVKENGLRARELCHQLGDPPETFMVVFSLFLHTNVRGERLDATERYANELLALTEKNPGLGPWRFVAYVARGTTYFYSARFTQAREWLLRALEIYDPHQHLEMVQTLGEDHAVFALTCLQHIEMFLGRVGEALRYVERTRAWVQQLRDPYGSTVASLLTLITYHMLGDYPRMAAEAERALQLSTEHGFFHWKMLAGISHGLARLHCGDKDVEGRLKTIDMGFGFIEVNGQWTARPYWASCKAEALMLVGRNAEAQRLIEETLTGSEGKQDQTATSALLRMKADLLAGDGDREGARALYHRALALAQSQSVSIEILYNSMHLARNLLETGQREEARALLSAAVADIEDGAGWARYEEAVRLMASLG
ncbi:MAG TPA: TOMM system kinase/cyclase fusion protein [Hyalangium sp.]|nr:TOMM system kinase/cyclase fusion protein [Hyalangium sp.]